MPSRPSDLRLIDSCITQLKAQGPSRTCNESKEEEEEGPVSTVIVNAVNKFQVQGFHDGSCRRVGSPHVLRVARGGTFIDTENYDVCNPARACKRLAGCDPGRALALDRHVEQRASERARVREKRSDRAREREIARERENARERSRKPRRERERV